MHLTLAIYVVACLCFRGLAFPIDARDDPDPCADVPESVSSSASMPSATVASGCAPMPSPTIPPVPNEIPDHYIVSFDASVDMASHLAQLQTFINTNRNCSTLNNSVTLQFDKSFYKFYAGNFDSRVLQFISHAAGVEGIERSATGPASRSIRSQPQPRSEPELIPSQNSTTSSLTHPSLNRRRSGATWNLQRITQDGPVTQGQGGVQSATSTDWTYFLDDSASGQDVVVYVIDTGVMSTHPELSPRVLSVSQTYIPQGVGPNTEDVAGHGTAVASVIAGMTFGVANQVQIVPIKVMQQYEDLMTDGGAQPTNIAEEILMDGIGTAIDHYSEVRKGKGSAIINLSITAWEYLKIDRIVKEAIDKGMHFVIAAGNNGKDMCNKWMPDVGQISVGATDIQDKKASFSNFGKCVDVYGPGKSIVAASLDGKTKPVDGTSFAAPHVAGIMAAILSKNGPMSPEALKTKILNSATGKVVDIANYPNSNDRLFVLDPTLRDLMG